jgi:hypothetical protein
VQDVDEVVEAMQQTGLVYLYTYPGLKALYEARCHFTPRCVGESCYIVFPYQKRVL